MLITSPANQHLRRARGVRDGREPELIFVEGERLCEECVQSGLELVACFHAPQPGLRALEVISEARRRECPIFEVAEAALDAVSDTVSSQGIIILAKRPRFAIEQVLAAGANRAGLLVCLDAVQDPGNFGTIVRTAEAAGASGVIALRGSVDAFAPKTLRSTMGSAFRLPIAEGAESDAVVAACHRAGIVTVATAADARVSYDDYDWRRPALIVFGNEAGGIRPELMSQCDAAVSIPIRPPVNSINVAASVAVILFEAARQRRRENLAGRRD
ncbi:MAG TPA: RNA methyltransferase [Blastocatellia bacterium]|nr:RNA methyltransferase [Blastocatellia bacterium]